MTSNANYVSTPFSICHRNFKGMMQMNSRKEYQPVHDGRLKNSRWYVLMLVKSPASDHYLLCLRMVSEAMS